MMGDKSTAKETMKKPACRWFPAPTGGGDIGRSLRIASEIGYPIMVKASAGGTTWGISM